MPTMEEDLTRILKTAAAESRSPAEDFLPLVYDELRRLAAVRMTGERADHTLQATALVHEAWMRISVQTRRSWIDRAHFFRTAAIEMRRILVDNARRKSSLKRSRGSDQISIHEIELAATQPDDRIILIDEALGKLEVKNPEYARIVALKFFGGLTDKEIAEVEGMGVRTVGRIWACARTCLFEMIQKEI